MQRGFDLRRWTWVCFVAVMLITVTPESTLAQGMESGEGAYEIDNNPQRSPETRVRSESRFPWQSELATSAADRPSIGRQVLRTIGWLGFVIVIAIAALFLVRKYFPGAVVSSNKNLIRVLGRGVVGPKHQIAVTQVGDRVLILGLTGDSMTALGEINDPKEKVKFTPADQTFAGHIRSEDSSYQQQSSAVSAGDGSDPESEVGQGYRSSHESRLEPYRREIDRLKSMFGFWNQQDPRSKRGSA